MGKLRSRPGFTLIELLVVVFIGGVLSALSIGKMQSSIRQQRISRAAQSVAQDMEAAWTLSVRNHRPVRITWTASSMEYAIKDRSGTAFRKRTLGADTYGLTSTGVTFSKNPLEIYPNGLAEDTLLITISGTDKTAKIRVSRGGMVRIE